MKKKELLKALIAHYQMCIDTMPIKNWRKFINKHNVEMGICSCAKFSFDTCIYDEIWVQKHNDKNSKYWGIRPTDVRRREKVIAALQFRLDIMNKIFSRYKTS